MRGVISTACMLPHKDDLQPFPRRSNQLALVKKLDWICIGWSQTCSSHTDLAIIKKVHSGPPTVQANYAFINAGHYAFILITEIGVASPAGAYFSLAVLPRLCTKFRSRLPFIVARLINGKPDQHFRDG